MLLNSPTRGETLPSYVSGIAAAETVLAERLEKNVLAERLKKNSCPLLTLPSSCWSMQ